MDLEALGPEAFGQGTHDAEEPRVARRQHAHPAGLAGDGVEDAGEVTELDARATDGRQMAGSPHDEVGLLDGALGVLGERIDDADDGDALGHADSRWTGSLDRRRGLAPGLPPGHSVHGAGLTPASRLRRRLDCSCWPRRGRRRSRP